MNSSLKDRLTEALDDEYKALAAYRKVIEKFGPIRPFVNIVEAEARHAAALLSLFERYGVPVPEDRWPERVTAPDTVEEACRSAVEAEIYNMAMYDRLLAATPEPDVRRVLENPRSASRDRHLPAFKRCFQRNR
ncbi:ferritin-like domain-containing protein [Methylocaldum gracile subsp. desertum]|uniref:ferritin-like domain-containing protein n=1 Tax=Methylocaldum sp. GT1BW TaxID=3438964 RepID=UPI003DA136ED